MARVEKKYVVQADSKISDIYSKLNSVQKQTISLFDTDRNGILNENEAKAFNNTVFSDKGDSIDCWIQLKSGKKQKVSVNKDEFDTKTLELWKTSSRKQIVKNGKKMNLLIKSEELYESSGCSLSEKFENNVPRYGGYKLVSTDKNGNKKYIQKGTAELSDGSGKKIAYENYVILDVSGNIIEESEADLVGESERFDGRIVTKGDRTEYYDIDNKKYGATQVNGIRTQYKDKNGQLLYSRVEHDEGYYAYYDENNKPLYEIKYRYGEPYADVTYLDKNGKPLKTEQAFVSAEPFHDNTELFKKLKTNPIENGYLHLH